LGSLGFHGPVEGSSTSVDLCGYLLGTDRKSEVRRLINEIVFGEESDIDQNGTAVSHFELYVQAMAEAGANTTPILTFIEDLKKGIDPKLALRQSDAPEGAKSLCSLPWKLLNEALLQRWLQYLLSVVRI
jgi:hypothetical protein